MFTIKSAFGDVPPLFSSHDSILQEHFSHHRKKMLLKLTLAAVIFAAVAAQSDSEIAAEIARLEAIQVSSFRGRFGSVLSW